MEGEAAPHGQGDEELPDHFSLKAVADDDGWQVRVELAPGAAGEVHHHPGQGLVQGHVGMGEPHQAGAVPQGLLEGITEAQAHILDQVVAVHGQVALGLDNQAEASVFRQLHQHVVEVAEARLDVGFAAVQMERELHVGFSRGAVKGGGPHGVS